MRLGGVWFFQAEDGIRDLVRSRGLGDVYKRQVAALARQAGLPGELRAISGPELAAMSEGEFAQTLSLIHI